jgi:hypothetical protein
MNADAKTALTLWGQWVRQGGDSTGTEYRSPSLVLLRSMVGSVVGTPPVSDEVPMTVDSILARLNKRDPEAYHVARRYYAAGMGTAAIARSMKITRYRVDACRQSAENYVAGVLDSFLLSC